MRAESTLRLVLGSIIFLSQFSYRIECSPCTHQAILSNSREIQEYTNAIIEKIYNTTETILSIPQEKQTFENTLKPWNRLLSQLFHDFDTLDPLLKPSSPFRATTSHAFDNLYTFLLETIQNPELYQALMHCAQKIMHDTTSPPFQQYIAHRFIKNDSNSPAYLHGFSDKTTRSTTNYTSLNLKHGFLSADQIVDMLKEILSTGADIVCVQELFTDSDAYDLYEMLKNDYAYFVYVPSAITLAQRDGKDGLLIASKFPLDQVQLDIFQKNENFLLGHVYAADLTENLLEKTQNVFSKIEKETAPFFPKKYKKEISAILCGGHADVSASKDSEGNSSVGGRASASYESDSGTKYSAEVSGRIEQDREGNVSSKVEVRGGIDW